MVTLSDALSAYRICAQAEGKSPKTVRWIMSSVSYFSDFMGPKQEINSITANDLRGFIIALKQRPKFINHPYNKPMQQRISAQSIQTYARAIRAFFSFLYREGFIDHNPTEGVRTPKVPKKVVPTFTEIETIRLLAQPDRHPNVVTIFRTSYTASIFD